MQERGPVETLEQCDTIHDAAARLAVDSPLDAMPIAKPLLGVLLRLAWVRMSGKALTAPDPVEIPHKLFQQNAATKPAMRRPNQAIRKETTSENLMDWCRGLIVWPASEPGAAME